MAEEEKIIFSVEVDNEEALKAVDAQTDKITELTAANERLRKEQKKVDSSTKEGLDERKKLGKQIAANNDQLKDERGERNRLLKVVKSNANSYNALSQQTAKLRKEQKNLDLSTKSGVKRYAELEKQINKNNTTLKKADAAVNVHGRNVGNYGDKLGSLSPALGGATNGIVSMTKAAIKFIATPLGAIIAAIVLGLKALVHFFKSSEEGQEALNKVSKVFQVIVGNLSDKISDFGKKIFEAFSKPKETLKSLGESIKTNIVNRVNGMLELFPALGRAIKKAFSGDFKAAAKEAGDAVAKVALGIEDFTDKAKSRIDGMTSSMKDLIAETSREIEIAKNLADRENALIKARRSHGIQIAKNRKIIQDLLLSYRDESRSAEERRDLIRQANKVKADELAINAKLAKENLELIKIQNSLSKSTIEDLDKQADAEKELFNIQAQNAAQLRELKNRENELDRKIFAQLKARTVEEAKLLSDVDSETEDFAQSIEDEINAETDKAITLAAINKEKNDTINEQDRIAAEERKQIAFGIAFAAADAANAALNFFQSNLEQKKQSELQNENLTNKEREAIEKKYAKKQQRLQITQALINGSLAIISALATQPFLPLGVAAGAAAATAVGFQIATIKNQKFARGGEVTSGVFQGASHASGGIQLSANGTPIAEVEGNEGFYVVNKQDNPAAIAALSAINSQHGNTFSTPIRFAQDGGEIEKGAISASQVSEAIQSAPIYVAVTDINEGQGNYVNVINNGTV